MNSYLKISLNFVLFLICIILGAIVAFSPLYAIAIFFLPVIFIFTMLAKVELLGSFIVIVTFFIVGPLASFLRFPKAFWLSYIIGLLFFIRGMIDPKFFNFLYTPSKSFLNNKLGAAMKILISLLLICMILGTVFNYDNVPQIIFGVRDYIWLWGVFFLVWIDLIKKESLEKWIGTLIWCAILQLPVVMYQHFWIYGKRIATVSDIAIAHDAIVGLFGGNPDGGGASGAMGVFCLIFSLMSYCLWRAKKVSFTIFISVFISSVLSVLFAEVKFVLLMTPFAILCLHSLKDIIRPTRIIFTLVLGGSIAIGGLYGYWQQYSGKGSKGYGSFSSYVTTFIDSNANAKDINLITGEMGRVSALTFWWHKHDLGANPVTFLVGHGIGSSRIGTFPGSAARYYSFKIARSSLAILLWEVGILGSSAVILILILGWKFSRVAYYESLTSPYHKAIFQAFGASFIILLCTLPYNIDIVQTPQIQLLMVIFFSYLYCYFRNASREKVVKKHNLVTVSG